MIGFSWMVYAADDGRNYALKVDNDYVNMGERGWSLAASADDYQYPRGWLPRAVVGMGADGRLHWAICASTGSALWVGETNAFTYRDTNGAFISSIVIGRRGERWLRIHDAAVPLMRPALAAYLAARAAA